MDKHKTVEKLSQQASNFEDWMKTMMHLLKQVWKVCYKLSLCRYTCVLKLHGFSFLINNILTCLLVRPNSSDKRTMIALKVQTLNRKQLSWVLVVLCSFSRSHQYRPQPHVFETTSPQSFSAFTTTRFKRQCSIRELQLYWVCWRVTEGMATYLY